MSRDPERYPYEHAIEDLVQRHFNLNWSFTAARHLPHDKNSRALMAIRQLVYDAMSDSFNRGIDFQKKGLRGMTVDSNVTIQSSGDNSESE